MNSRSQTTISIFSPLGWLLSALSVLSIADNLDRGVISGQLSKWVTAYSSVVYRIWNTLFGWVDIYWISISELEMHLLTISVILISAIGRASYISYLSHAKDQSKAIHKAFDVVGSLLLLAFLPALLLPGKLGAMGACLWIALYTDVHNDYHASQWEPGWLDLAKELLGVFSFVIVLIAISHAFL